MRFQRYSEILVLCIIGVSANLEKGIMTKIPGADLQMKIMPIVDVIRTHAAAMVEDFNVHFLLCTLDRPVENPYYLIDGDIRRLRRSSFDPRYPTRIITTGWLNHGMNLLNRQITRAYLARGPHNVINVDWSEAAVDPNYVVAAAKTVRAGKKLASLIRFLESEGGLDVNNTYLIGHSLGAHVSGFAGKLIKPRKINTIFGLDPAKPLFHVNNTHQHLSKGDAQYVETIHSDAGVFGEVTPLGDASFFPGYGRMQPGCLDVTTLCDHFRSIKYFHESLQKNNQFYGVECQKMDDIKERNCRRTGRGAYMGGEPSNYGRNITRIYYVPVKYKGPHAMGKF